MKMLVLLGLAALSTAPVSATPFDYGATFARCLQGGHSKSFCKDDTDSWEKWYADPSNQGTGPEISLEERQYNIAVFNAKLDNEIAQDDIRRNTSNPSASDLYNPGIEYYKTYINTRNRR